MLRAHRACVASAVALFGTALLAAGCGSEPADDAEGQLLVAAPDAPDAIEVGPGEPVVVGVSTALTGPVGERGTEYRDAVILGVLRWQEANGEDILGHPIEVYSEDDGCTEADHTVVAARRLVGVPGLVGVIGPQCSSGASAVLPAYADAGVVTISGSATATALTAAQRPDGYFFRTAFRNDLQGSVVADFVVETLKADAVVLVDNGETYGRDLAASAEGFLAQAGVTVTRASAPQGTIDFRELAARIARSPPDAVGYAGFNPDAALFYRQLRDAGYDGAFGSFDAAASRSEFVLPLGEIAEGVLFAGCAIPLPEDLRRRFAEIHGSSAAAAFVGQYADAVRALLDAVARTARRGADGSLTIDRQGLRDAVRATAIEDGLTGAIRFDARGDRTSRRTDPSDRAADLGLSGCRVEDSELVAIQGD